MKMVFNNSFFDSPTIIDKCSPHHDTAVKALAEEKTGRTPRWCDVRDDDGNIAPAPTDEAMDDCIALDSDGNVTEISHWMNQVPCGENVEAVCYF